MVYNSSNYLLSLVGILLHLHQFVGVEPHLSHLGMLLAKLGVTLGEVLNQRRVTILLEGQRAVVDGIELRAAVRHLPERHSYTLNGTELVIVNDVLRIVRW